MIVSSGQVTATAFSKVLNGKYSHDQLTRFLSKNEIMKDRLSIIVHKQKLKFAYITSDMWFGSSDNMNFFHHELKKKFVIGLKSNRNIALTKEDHLNKKWCKMTDIDMKGCDTHLIYVKGIDFPLSLIKLVPKNRDDSNTTYSYLITDDITLSYSEIHSIYQKRWKVEEFHKSLKQQLYIKSIQSVYKQMNLISEELEHYKQQHSLLAA